MNIATLDWQLIKLGDVIGEGSFGKVYLAEWGTKKKKVAVKRINFDVSLEYVEREFKHLSRAEHINIIFLHGIAINDNIHYLVMEYADGGSLHNMLYKAPRKDYTLVQAIDWSLQAANGVAYLHAKIPVCVIHRDLKPQNMLLHDEGRCLKICDFGSVRCMSSMMTKNSGTAPYMAPEVFNGNKYTSKCDVYSWSITMWEILSRKVPYAGFKTELEVCKSVEEGERPDMKELIFDCPKEIQNLMEDGWKEDPNERPTMNDIVQVLSKYST